MIQNDLQNLAHPITELQLLPGNPRRGDIEAVKRSLEAFGQRKPIVVRRSDSVVIAGNHTLQAAQALGWDEIAVVWVDDDEVTSKAFALADNRTAELGDYDEEALADLINDVGSLNPGLLESSGWDDKAVKELLDRVEQIELPTDVDEVPEDVPAVSKLGDVWLLGEHRLMCGDSTKSSDMNKLCITKPSCLVTDPPYGIGIDGQKKSIATNPKHNRKAHEFRGWDISRPDATTFNLILELNIPTVIWGGNYFADLLPATRGWIYWSKGQDGLTMSDGELAWTTENKPLRSITVNRNALRDSVHPTQKPVEVMAFAIKYLDCDGVVLDLFGGSGSTLIAAQETNRVAYLMELDPQYVDVICARYQKHTGILPVLESSKKVHDFLNA